MLFSKRDGADAAEDSAPTIDHGVTKATQRSHVLRVTGGAVTEIVTFHDDQFPRLGLPDRLPADDTQ